MWRGGTLDTSDMVYDANTLYGCVSVWSCMCERQQVSGTVGYHSQLQ